MPDQVTCVYRSMTTNHLRQVSQASRTSAGCCLLHLPCRNRLPSLRGTDCWATLNFPASPTRTKHIGQRKSRLEMSTVATHTTVTLNQVQPTHIHAVRAESTLHLSQKMPNISEFVCVSVWQGAKFWDCVLTLATTATLRVSNGT